MACEKASIGQDALTQHGSVDIRITLWDVQGCPASGIFIAPRSARSCSSVPSYEAG